MGHKLRLWSSSRSFAGGLPRLPLVLLWLACAAPAAQAAEIYGLVIGINDYIGERNDLQGAVNDAIDIATALEAAGAKRVVRFLDEKASKDNIEQAWKDLVAESRKGDTIIFTFAGHGSQEPEPEGRHDEPDGKNENFLLSAFETEGEGSRERIVDDEIFLWLKQADDKGVRVVFVADSCHSGSMHRSVRTGTVRYRNADFGEITQDMLEFPPPTAARLVESDYANVTFVGATSEDRLTPEVTISGKKRGALSWAFARAVEGRADRDRNGEITQLELLGFVVPAVHAKVESQQTPQISPLRARSVALFQVRSFEKPDATKDPKQATPTEDKLRVALVDGEPDLLKGIPHVSLVEDKTDADLVWYVKEGRVDHAIGGKVAENVEAAAIRPVLSKWAALKWLKQHAAEDPVQVKLANGNNRYDKGQLVQVEIADAKYPRLTLFNLPPDGRVEFFIPDPARPRDASKDWSRSAFRESFRVQKPPFGAEHMVAIFSEKPLTVLHAALARMGHATEAIALLEILQERLAGKTFQVGVLDIYTGGGE